MSCVWEGRLIVKDKGSPEAIFPAIDCRLVRITAFKSNTGRVWLGGAPDRPAPIPVDPAQRGNWDQTPVSPGPVAELEMGTPLEPSEPIDWECRNSGDIWIDVEQDGEGISFSVFT